MESLDASCSWRRRGDGLWKLEAASWPFAAKISRPRRMKYQNSSDEAWLRQWLSLHTCSWNWHDLVAPDNSQRQQCLGWFFDGCHHMMSPLMCSLRCDSYRCNNNNNNNNNNSTTLKVPILLLVWTIATLLGARWLHAPLLCYRPVPGLWDLGRAPPSQGFLRVGSAICALLLTSMIRIHQNLILKPVPWVFSKKHRFSMT